MRLRTRLTAAFTGVTAVALIASFTVTYLFVQRDELREIDHALLVQAEHASALAVQQSPDNPLVRDGNGEITEPPSLTTRYAAVYDRDDGKVVSFTRSFGNDPVKLESIGTRASAPAGTAVDFQNHGVRLRGVLVPLGAHRTLLFAVTRVGVDADLNFLLRIFGGLFAAATLLTFFVARWLARSLVHDVDAIYEVADAVAAGKLEARVGGKAKGSVETRLLAERLDRMIERLEELVVAQRQFISSAAHELRSPLTSLRGELELALRRDRPAEEYKETIEMALADAVSLVSLADDLLAIARVEGRRRNTEKEVTHVTDLVAEAARMARGNAEARNIGVVVKEAAKDVSIACSRKDVSRALRNLIDNAIAHSPNGKSISVKTAITDDHVDIAVEDEGSGVRPEDAPLLFAPFWRGKGERAGESSGAGLGLALAREIARAEGGDVAFDAAFSPGARFVLSLPLERT